MLLSYRRWVTFSSLTAIGLLLASCSESKVAQCNKLIEIANQAVSDVQQVTQNASPEDVNAFLEIANTADQAAESLQALELQDEQLQGYRQQFVTMYTDTSQATRDLVSAVEAQNPASAQEAYTALEDATNREAPLVNEVNTYCSGS